MRGSSSLQPSNLMQSIYCIPLLKYCLGFFLISYESVSLITVIFGYFLIFVYFVFRSSAQSLGKSQKRQLYSDLTRCLELVEPADIKSNDHLVGS